MPSNQKFGAIPRSVTELSSSSPNQNQSQYTFEMNPSYSELSHVESIILRSTCPLTIEETEEISVLGQKGIWVNKSEDLNWKGPIPLNEYKINEDPDPEIINKKVSQNIVYIQELAIRYLKPPTPAKPGDIIIRQEDNLITPPAPPLIIRQQPPRPATPDPLVVREAPPEPPKPIPKRIITISGKRLPPPPRKVVIERLAPIPAKPQSVIIERWLPYTQLKRRVVLQRHENSNYFVKPKNVIVQWEAPQVQVKKDLKYLGVIRADPIEYVHRYGSTLKKAKDLPTFVNEIKPPNGIVLAADSEQNQTCELEGDVEALEYIDLDKEGLSEYKSQLQKNYVNNLNLKTQSDSSTQASAYYNQVYSAESVNKNLNLINSLSIISEIFGQVNTDQLKLDQAERLYNKLMMYLGRMFKRDDFKRFLLTVNSNSDGTIDIREFRKAFENFI